MFFQGRVQRAVAGLLILSAAGVSTACGDEPGIGVTPVETTRNISFSTTIQSGGFAWRSFQLERAGKVTVQYVSIAPQADLVMRLSLGTFDGTNCTATTTLDTPPQATGPQITSDVAAGNYCVRINDIGNVSQIAVFAIAIAITTPNS